MKVLLFSDLHLDYPADPSDGSVALFQRTSAWLVDQINKHQPELVVNLGDTNHRDGGMSTGTIKMTYDFFEPIATAVEDCGGSLVHIIGNHDQHTRDGGLHVMEMLKWRSRVVDEPMFLRCGKSNTPFVFLPYNRDVDLFKEGLAELIREHGEPELGFMHMDVIGAQMNSGSKTTHGVEFKDITWKLFNGHYHMPQTVGGIEVVGAPQYTQFRDTDPMKVPRRGAMLLTRQKNGKWKQQRLSNPHTNAYVKFKGESASELLLMLEDWLHQIQKQYTEDITGKFNVWFVGPQVALAELEANRDWSAHGTVRFTPNDRVTTEKTNITLDLNAEKAVERYFEESSCSCGEAHDLKTGLDLIRKADDYVTGSASRRKITFREMEMSDFMQFESAQVGFDGKGLVLIEGINQDDSSVESNESGKSTIVEALLWTLFDKTSRGIGKDDVIRWGTKKASVTVKLEADGKAYSITRTRTKGRQILNVVDADGKDITPHDQNAATELVRSIVGVTCEQFLLLVVMAQGFETKFSSLNDTDRKETLEAFLGLEVYDFARKLVTDEIKLKEGIIAGLDSEVDRAIASVRTAEGQLNVATMEKTRLMNEVTGERAVLEETIEKLSAVIGEWQGSYGQGEKYLRDQATKVNGISNELRKAERNYETAQRDGKSLVAEFNAASARLVSYQTNGAACQTCEQQLPQDKVTRLASKEAELVASLQGRINHAHTTFTESGQKKTTLQAELTAANTDLAETTVTVTEVGRQLVKYQSERESFKRELDKTTKTTTQFDAIIENALNTIKAHQAAAGEAQDRRVTMVSEIHQLKFWADAFDPTGIRSHLLRTVVNYLNEYLHDLAQAMTGGTFSVQLSSTKELKSGDTRNKLDVMITPSNESYKAGSGGKRRKIDLMLNLAVAKLARQTSGFSTNIFVADEVLDNLDFTASQFAVNVFEKMATEGVTVLLISHNHLVKSMIPNAWTVVRRNGVSTLQA